MVKHTPGPWSVTEDVVGRAHVDSQYAGPGRDYTPVADIHQGEDDARLIAAAPEMLAIVRRAANIPEMLEIELTLSDDARALLAKIEGGE